MSKFTREATAVLVGLVVGMCAACGGSPPTPVQAPPTSPPEPTETDLPTQVPATATLEPTATITPIPVSLEDLLGIWSTSGHYLVFGEDSVVQVALNRSKLDNEDWFAEDEGVAHPLVGWCRAGSVRKVEAAVSGSRVPRYVVAS